jgi:hypothetical protein
MMKNQHSLKAPFSCLVKSIAFWSVAPAPTLALIFVLLCLLPSYDAAFAGENIWTWGGVGGNAEVILSNPLSPGTAYAIIDNQRLFRTVDSGSTWSELPPLPHAGTALNLRFAPNDDQVLYLWGFDSVYFLYRSLDAGNSWQALSKAGEIAISPADWKEIYLSSGGSLFKSIDGGDTWDEVSQFTAECPLPYRFSIAPSAPQTMISVFNPPNSMDFFLCKSVDGGRNWSRLAISSPVIHSVAFDPKNSNTIYLASIGGGWKSVDGGSTWQPIANGLNNPSQFIIDPDNTQIIHASDLNQTGGVFESLDGGMSWAILDAGIQGLSVRTIAIGSRAPLKIYAGTMFSGIWEMTRADLQDYSITVNDSALFTNQTAVTLTLTAPPGTTQMILSNDGSFEDGAWEVFAKTKPWTITSYGTYVIPRTVYAKFMTKGKISGQYQDDIVLDESPPTGSLQIDGALLGSKQDYSYNPFVATNALTIKVFLPILGKEDRPGMRPVMLELSAIDEDSGVDSFLVSNEDSFTGAEWQDYTTLQEWWVPDHGMTTVYVKYRDRAGNQSSVYTAVTSAP